MATKYKLSYTAADIDEKLGKVNTLPTSQDVKIANANTLSKARLYHNRQQPTNTQTDEWRNIMSDMALLKLQMAMLKYDLSYYSSMGVAVNDVNAGSIGSRADATKENAVVGVYTDDNGGVNVVLLKDTTETAKITAIADMTINLGGKTIEFVNTAVGIATSSSSPVNNFTVDGSLNGSTIKISNEEVKNTKALQLFSGNCTVIGGSYIANANGAGTQSSPNACVAVGGTANVTIYNASITANDYNGGALFSLMVNDGSSAMATNCIFTSNFNGNGGGLHIPGTVTVANCDIVSTSTDGVSWGVINGGCAIITDCNVTATSTNGESCGIANNADMVITDSNIKAYSNYTTGTETYYDALSIGVENKGTMTINGCYVMGTHSGLENDGTVTVNGGTYEGFGHGGFYFEASDTISYVRDAIIRDCEMPDGYTATANRNGAGMYISGTNAINQTVYMDSCDIYGSAQHQTIAIASSYGAQNNSLYISNSTINNLNGGVGHVRIDDVTHKLYIGSGNNFIIDNVSLGEAVVETDEVYVQS